MVIAILLLAFGITRAVSITTRRIIWFAEVVINFASSLIVAFAVAFLGIVYIFDVPIQALYRMMIIEVLEEP